MFYEINEAGLEMLLSTLRPNHEKLRRVRKPVEIHISGSRALFSKPDVKEGRETYEVPTLSALQSIIDAVYWHPGITTIPVLCVVHRPMRFDRVEECPEAIDGENKAFYPATYLKDVEYTVYAVMYYNRAEIGAADSPQKFEGIMTRRLNNGQHYRSPYLGARECPLSFSQGDLSLVNTTCGISKDLGQMFLGYRYQKDTHPVPVYQHTVMENGVIDYTKGTFYFPHLSREENNGLVLPRKSW